MTQLSRATVANRRSIFNYRERIRLMRVLFDHNVPSGTARALRAHEVAEASQCGWDKLSNEDLLAKAEAAGFDVVLTADKNIRYQQNPKGRKIAVIVIGNPTWRVLRRNLDRITGAVNAAKPCSYLGNNIVASHLEMAREGRSDDRNSRP